MANLNALMREAPLEATGKVKELIEFCKTGNYGSYLAPYSDSELSQARQILRTHNLKPALRRAIEMELVKRYDVQNTKQEKGRNASLEQCAPMWDAVRALFGKGPWKRSAPEVKRNLAFIQDDWGKRI